MFQAEDRVEDMSRLGTALVLGPRGVGVRGNTAGDGVRRGGGALIRREHCRSGKDLDSVPCDRMVRPPRGFQEKEAKIWCIF